MPKLSLLIVEDDPDVRAALVRGLPREGFDVVAACASVSATRAAIRGGARFDLALVDLSLPDEPGVRVMPDLRRAAPNAVLVAFTVHEDPPTVLAALRAGARGYLLKSTSLKQLARSLAEAHEGGAPMTPSIARLVVEELARPRREDEPERAPEPLTDREKDVLAILARGHTYADAASALGISLGTVQSHVKAIYAKLEVASKAEAALAAARYGIV